MIRSISKTALTFAFAAVITCLLDAAPKGPAYDGIRSMGMGNTTVAVTTDRTAIFHNPAGLSLLQDDLQVSLAPVIMSFFGNITDYIDFVGEHGDKLDDINQIDTTFIQDLSSLDGQWIGLDYFPEFTVATKNLGFGFYSVWPVALSGETGHLVPKFNIRGQQDLVLTWAVGVPLKHENNLFGISMEYVRRAPVENHITKYSDTHRISQDFDQNVLSSLGILGDLADIQHGVSFDVGFMHNIKGFRLAYALKDFFAVVGGKVVVPQLDLGGAYYFPFTQEIEIIRSLIVALEISDIWGFEPVSKKYEHFAKKLHAGAEIDFTYLALRGGINQGYPTFGVGAMLGPLSLNYVYFTEELGYFPGQRPNSRHVFSAGLSLNIKVRKGFYSSPEESAPTQTVPAENTPEQQR
ncbi:MAG: hypothetical protein GF398_07590 [Chitinivibrionales bacterium]|nr:hypothetical protein [Chitinivibrionales bacterium]